MDDSKKANGSLYDAFEKFFDTKESADMNFVIHGKELQAHKVIVLSRSSVLKAGLHGPMASKNNKFSIDDPNIDFVDFENFIRFLYTDNCVINEKNVERMIRLGDMYDVKLLLEKCVSNIIKWLNADNILRYAELGLLYGNSCTLLNKCFEALPNIMSLSWPLAYRSEDGKSYLISSELALKMVEICPRSNVLTECKLFKKVYEWAELKAAEELVKNNNNKNVEISDEINSIMAPLIPHFSFERMCAVDLAEYVYPSKCLSAENFSKLITKVITSRKKIHGISCGCK